MACCVVCKTDVDDDHTESCVKCGKPICESCFENTNVCDPCWEAGPEYDEEEE